MLIFAEKFSLINSLTENDLSNYPALRLSDAWEAKIYPDHGWGKEDKQQMICSYKFVLQK
ncbi:MAG: hypothetical protein IPH62_19850 [Ignavibacteriae bacterium]|nr:hypothetical protein [Ignavibacteriota bacterium]